MKNPIQISIPQPCHENWASMTPVDKGRFCASCQKNVVDFTRSSDREIAKALQTGDTICARFLPSQLDRDLMVPKEKSPVWTAAAVLLSMASLTSANLAAQTTPAPEQLTMPQGIKLGKVAMPTKIVSGVVSDETGLPLPGVTVSVDGSQAKTYTDFDGNYRIEANAGNELSYTSPGFVSQKYTITTATGTVNITLIEEEMGEVVLETFGRTRVSGIAGGYTIIQRTDIADKNRTFFGRIFHSIGNLFR